MLAETSQSAYSLTFQIDENLTAQIQSFIKATSTSRNLDTIQTLIKLFIDPQAIAQSNEFKAVKDEVVKKKALSLVELIHRYYTQEEGKINESVIDQLKSIMNAEQSIWEAASILLYTPSIVMLPISDFQKLKQTVIKQCNGQKIMGVCLELFRRHKGLESKVRRQLAEKSFKNRKITNVDNFISQIIVKAKPKQHGIVEKLRVNRNNCKLFQGQNIVIFSQMGRNIINGQIDSAEYSEGVFYFQVKQEDDTVAKVKLHTSDTQIKRINIQRQYHLTLQEWIKSIAHKPQLAETRTLIEHCKISKINKLMNYSTSKVLADGQYMVEQFQFKDKKAYILYFNLLDSQDEVRRSFKVIFNKYNKIVNVEELETEVVFEFSDFVRNTMIEYNQQKYINYRSKKDTAEAVKITKPEHNQRNIFEIMEDIRAIKSQMVKHMLQFDSKQLESIILTYSQTQSIEGIEIDSQQITDGLRKTLKFCKEAHMEASEQNILKQIISDANYASLVDKQGVVASVKTIELFALAQNSVKTVEKKNIIGFYGNTGAGKSTAVNYFTRIPLKKGVNRFGDSIVQVEEQKLNEEERNNRCLIGQCSGISQTLSARGYQISKEKLTEDDHHLSDIVFCDNPGFNDTRGTSYEIVTNLSMDRAIQECESIRAIVLMIPYQTIKMDRGNHIIDLFDQMEQRFPNLLNTQSQVYQNFYIIITKWTDDEYSKETVADRILSFEKEYDDMVRKQTEADNANKTCSKFELAQLKKKRQYFSTFYQMCSQKVDFIDISDEFQRDEILSKYLQSGSLIEKQQYMPTMQNNLMVRQFTQQISVSAHSWTTQIIQPSMNLPEQKEKTSSRIYELEGEINLAMIQKMELEEQLQTGQNDLKEEQQLLMRNKNEFKRVKEGRFTEQEREMIESASSKISLPSMSSEYQNMITQSQQAIIKLEAKMQEKQRIVRELRTTIEQIEEEFDRITEEIDKNDTKIKSWHQGQIRQNIIDQSYELQQEMEYGDRSFTKAMRNQYIKQGKKIPQTSKTKRFLAGQLEKQLCQIYKIQRYYKLWPSQNFDPKKYLQKKQKIQDGQQYNSHIESRFFNLENIRFMKQGRVMMLSTTTKFIVTDDPQMLPFLKIDHYLPSQDHYAAEIKNTLAQGKVLNQKKKDLEEELKRMKNKKQSLKHQIQEILKMRQSQYQNVKNYQRNNEKDLQKQKNEKSKKTRQEKKQLYLNNWFKKMENSEKCVNICQKKIEHDKWQLQQLEKRIAALEDQKRSKQQLFQTELIREKRLSFLIRDQVNKGTLQAMVIFCTVAYKMCDKIVKNNRVDENNKESYIDKKSNFSKFLKMYSQLCKSEKRSIEAEQADIRRNQSCSFQEQTQSLKRNRIYEQPLQENQNDSDLVKEQEDDDNVIDLSRMKKKIKPNESQF